VGLDSSEADNSVKLYALYKCTKLSNMHIHFYKKLRDKALQVCVLGVFITLKVKKEPSSIC
jgi:hypothetical protein